MSRITVNSPIDPALQAQAEAIFAKFGLSADEAIQMYYQEIVAHNGMGVNICLRSHTPNADTIEAVEAIERGEITEIKGGIKGLRKLWDES